MADNSPAFKPSVPELTLPAEGFLSKIPDHLLDETDPATKWIMEEISKNTQVTEFTLHATLKHNEYLRQLNGRVGTNEGAIAKIKNEVKELIDEAEAMSTFRKVVLALSKLWEYRFFRWTVYAAAFFFFTYLLPWYVDNPPSIGKVLEALLGGH